MSDKVCAVIDFQGFMIGSTFIPRELAIVNEYFAVSFLIDHGVEYTSLSNKTREKIKYQTANIHGLSFNIKDEPSISASDIDAILLFIHERLSSRDRPVFACKSYQTTQLLENTAIPYIDLDEV